MKTQADQQFENALHSLRSDLPEERAVEDSARTVASQLGIVVPEIPATIRNCEDVRRLLPAHRDGTLPEARARLVDAHLRECGACLRASRGGMQGGSVDWSLPRPVVSVRRRPAAFGWAWALACALLVGAFFIYRFYWEVPPGVRAEVESVDGPAYLILGSSERPLSAGASLREGDQVRTGGSSHAVLRLSDGSRVEVNQRSALSVGARGRNLTVSLDGGTLIVDAAKRGAGHLYVMTPDCRVAVKGTIFSVDSGLKGSRVAVLQGTVQVAHAGINSVLHPGDQMATSDNLGPAPVAQQIAWSADRDKYLQLLAQFSVLRTRIEQIPFPQPRYTSDILPRVPANTVLYVSIPNLGEFLGQANAIFKDQLGQSPVLQQWWSRGHEHNTAELDELVEKLRGVSEYLGDEVVVVGRHESDRPDFAVIADVQRSGLADLLKQQFSAISGGLTVFTEDDLAKASDTPGTRREVALVRQHEVIFAGSVSALKEWNSQLNSGGSGFAAGDFGSQISAAYGRGAGIILAADLHQMITSAQAGGKHVNQALVQSSGIEGAQYLVAEHRETNNGPANHLNVSFTGSRQRVASWLGSPAPMGSLDFVTPNAAVAVAVLSKDPKAIADDILSMAAARPDGHNQDLTRTEADLQISLRDDLMATLGGEFLISLDGPVLPTPSWKAVIEVNDPARLQNTLERLVAASGQFDQKGAGKIAIEPTDVSGQRFYEVRNVATGATVADYTFAEGYMLAAPSRAVLIEALHAHDSGSTLGRSAAFRALLPHDANENYSAVAYQNLSPVLTPLLSQLSGESAAAVRKLAADARPTAVCAWGKDNRIEVASDSRLFGFDFLTLGALLDSRNKLASPSVMP